MAMSVVSQTVFDRVVGIGGLFAPDPANGEWDVDQAEHLAAFIMAVNDINDKTDGIFDDLLPTTKLVYMIQDPTGALGTAAAMTNWGKGFNESGIFGFVSAQPSEETVIADMIEVESKIIQVDSVAQDARLSQFAYYPYKLLTVPVSSYDGLVMQSLLCSFFNARRIVVVADSGYQSRATVNELLDESFCVFEVLDNIELRTADDFSWSLEDAKASGGRYFALILQEPAMAAGFLEYAQLTGAFNENTVIITTEEVSTNVFQHLSPNADVSETMRGLFGVKMWPDFGLKYTSAGSSFVERFAAQKSRTGSIVNGKRVCDGSMDDNQGFHLYRAQNNASFCTGLDFGSFAGSSTSLNPSTPLTYDAVLLLASVLHIAIENEIDLADADAVLNLAISNISFEGVSGPIEIDDGEGDFQTFGRGTREVGVYYYITNFNAEEYAAGNVPMVPIGNWSYDGRYSTCSPALPNCFDPVFRSGLAEVVPDMPSPILRYMSIGTQSAVILIGALNFLTLLLLTFVTLKYHKAKQIKASQPVMLYTILVGGAFALARGLLGIVPVTDAVCGARVFVGHLTFAVLFGSLFVKVWRVHVLVNSKTLRRIKFSATQAFLMLLQIVCVTVVFLLILQFVAVPELSYASAVSSNQEYQTPRCVFHYNEFETVLMIMEALFMLYGFRLCWNIRNVPVGFNESMSISQGENCIPMVDSNGS
jgi:hypothetical protein